jgi:hypothetical protein
MSLAAPPVRSTTSHLRNTLASLAWREPSCQTWANTPADIAIGVVRSCAALRIAKARRSPRSTATNAPDPGRPGVASHGHGRGDVGGHLVAEALLLGRVRSARLDQDPLALIAFAIRLNRPYP